ncbi:unnamed protein product, partial [Prorocentrum cordatum]
MALDAQQRWQKIKVLMRMVAGLARDQLQRGLPLAALNLLSGAKMHGLPVVFMAPLLSLVATWPSRTAASSTSLMGGAFRNRAMDCNQGRFDAIGQRPARAGRRRRQQPQGDGSPAGVPEMAKVQVTSMRRALAWNPTQRRLVLDGFKHDQPADGAIIRSPTDMANATREHWEPVFAAASGSDEAIPEYLACLRLYGILIIPCLSYLCQFFFLPFTLLQEELLALRKLSRLPPSSFSLAELLSLQWLHMPEPLRAMSVAVIWRAAGRTFRGWGIVGRSFALEPSRRRPQFRRSEPAGWQSSPLGLWRRSAVREQVLDALGLEEAVGILAAAAPAVEAAPAAAEEPPQARAGRLASDDDDVSARTAYAGFAAPPGPTRWRSQAMAITLERAAQCAGAAAAAAPGEAAARGAAAGLGARAQLRPGGAAVDPRRCAAGAGAGQCGAGGRCCRRLQVAEGAVAAGRGATGGQEGAGRGTARASARPGPRRGGARRALEPPRSVAGAPSRCLQ